MCLAVTGGAALVLSPSSVVVWAGAPYFTVVGDVRVPSAERSVVVLRVVVEFLIFTTLSGALVGWPITGIRRGTVAMGVATFAFALGPGQNPPFFHVVTASQRGADGGAAHAHPDRGRERRLRGSRCTPPA